MGALGIDIGTTSISLTLLDESPSGSRSWTYPNDTSIGGVSWEHLQDAERIAVKVISLIDGLLAEGVRIESIGLSGQMHGILYVDDKGKAVSPLFTWEDGRGNLPFRDGASYAESLSSQTGYKVSTGFGLVTHYYNVLNGLVPKDAAKICTVMDYVAMTLTSSGIPLIDPSNAASLGCFDLASCSFDSDVLATAGIDTSLLPEVCKSPSVVGYFKGIPVVTAIGDNQASFLGSVSSPEKSFHITVGTSSQISVFTRELSMAPGIDTRPLPGGGYIMVGAALCGGSSLALLNGFLAGAASFLTGEVISTDEVYERMCSVGFRPFSDSDLRVRTTFRGTREEPTMKGLVDNISFDNWNVEDLILGFHRGVADELYSFFDKMPESARAGKDMIVGSGNALHRNNLLVKVIESRFGLPLSLSSSSEEAAMGSAIIANRLIDK